MVTNGTTPCTTPIKSPTSALDDVWTDSFVDDADLTLFVAYESAERECRWECSKAILYNASGYFRDLFDNEAMSKPWRFQIRGHHSPAVETVLAVLHGSLGHIWWLPSLVHIYEMVQFCKSYDIDRVLNPWFQHWISRHEWSKLDSKSSSAEIGLYLLLAAEYDLDREHVTDLSARMQLSPGFDEDRRGSECCADEKERNGKA